MGSGISGNYKGTCPTELSQPYALTYQVVDDLFELDKKDSDIYDSINGYFKNPTSTNLEKSIVNDCILIGNRPAHGIMAYIMDEDGNIIFGIRHNPNNINKRAPHPTLVGGKNPKVKCAGMITFSKGKIVDIDNKSGHFKPNIKSMAFVNEFMDNLYTINPELFNKKSKWRKKNERN